MTLVARSGETTTSALESDSGLQSPGLVWDAGTPEVLARLAGDERASVRWRVAGDPGTPPEALAALAGDDDAAVRRAAAENPGTPPEVLAELAGDDRDLVRRGVSRNSRTPPEALAELSRDEDYLTRRRVASNTATPEAVLRRLAGDGSGAVREAAERELLGRRLRRVLASSGAADLYAAVGEDPLAWDEDRQRQLLRELGENA